jgi:glycosyltransferase involved in cell wall biosynthesis
MTEVKTESLKTDLKFPSFSVVYETENLASVELENIYHSLASLAAQDISPEQANEILIIDSGHAPPKAIEQLCSMYPWITVRQVPGIGYHEAKMMGATLTTGEILLMCDSDCVYESGWLRNMLTPFAQNPDIDIVGGETSTPVRNPYELAIAINFFFPRFSRQKELYESNDYYLNNVAFRRDFLLQHPLPCNLPLYRGNCHLHGYYLQKLQGVKIWRHPQARATHEPPQISLTFFWRYLLYGHDQVVKKRLKLLLKEDQDLSGYSKLSVDLNQTSFQKICSIASEFVWTFNPRRRKRRIMSVLREDPSRLISFPISFLIILWFDLLYLIGSTITYCLESDLLLDLYNQAEID